VPDRTRNFDPAGVLKSRCARVTGLADLKTVSARQIFLVRQGSGNKRLLIPGAVC
jgi:hypothetical protein